MENFINSFNYKPFMWDFISFSIALLVMFCVISILFEIYYYVLSDKKETIEDGKVAKTKKYKIIIPISIIILIFAIQKYVEPKEMHHINDNYNISVNDNMLLFDIKNSNIFANNKQTFIVTKENDNYKLENIEKPYETYNLTKNEFLDIFKPKTKPTNSVNIQNELKQ